jgi:hypothetical protein
VNVTTHSTVVISGTVVVSSMPAPVKWKLWNVAGSVTSIV